MATVCCSTLSLTEIIGMFSLGNHELRLYRTCKAIFETHQVRRDWWRHLQLADSLAWHLDPSKAQRSWDSFFAWREYVLGDPLPVAIPSLRPMSDEEDDGGNAVANRVPTAILEDYPESDEDSMSRYSYSSCPDYPPAASSESDFSEDDITVLDWATGGRFGQRPPPLPPCERCGILPSTMYSAKRGDLVCYRCPQSETNHVLSRRWGLLLRTHRVFGDFGITRHIVDFLLGDGLHKYCSCGRCNSNWFLHGWVCHDYH